MIIPRIDAGEEVVEPEVDLSAFLERQRLDAAPPPALSPPDESDGVDATLAHFLPKAHGAPSRKGQTHQIEWDAELERLSREKAAAEATRGALVPFDLAQQRMLTALAWHTDLKTRFRAQTTRQHGKPVARGGAPSHAARGACKGAL